MNIEIHYTGTQKIAEIVCENMLINTVQDALDLMGELYFQDLNKMILHEKNIAPAFFDLKTGMAGEILQKYSNYRMGLAIVGDFEKYPGNSIRDFIFESNKLGQINFVRSVEEAKTRLAK